MPTGILASVTITLVWGLAFVACVHRRTITNRFRLMTACWLASWPFLAGFLVVSRRIPLPAVVCVPVVSLDLIHAVLCHTLAFFFLVECYYHVDRSVTLRILTELLGQPGRQATAPHLMHRYDTSTMVAERLSDLGENGHLVREGDAWRLTAKGRFFARVMAVSTWICRSKSQKDRVV